MAEAILMPRQGQSVETCIITKWLKGVGEHVGEGDLLFSYETDKAAFDQSSEVGGTLLAVFYDEGDEVPVLSTVAVIGDEGEDISDFREGSKESVPREDAAKADETDKDAGQSGEAHAAGAKEIGAQSGGMQAGGMQAGGMQAEASGGGAISGERAGGATRISPRARKMAETNRIEVGGIAGSGPNGRIIAADVEKILNEGPAASGQADTPVLSATGEYSDEKLTNIRRIISEKMHRSLQMSAQLTHHTSADARMILSLRKQVKSGEAPLLPDTTNLNDMVCYALVQVLKEFPDVNAHFLGDRIRKFRSVHLGIAVDTGRGLMVPVVKNAERYTLGGLGEAIREIAAACRNGTIDPDLLVPEAATFTVSNLGIYDVEMFTPVLNLPQVGILGINAIVQRPADLGDGSIGFIPHMGLSLTYDHRAIDGAPASRFLQEVKKKVETLNYN